MKEKTDNATDSLCPDVMEQVVSTILRLILDYPGVFSVEHCARLVSGCEKITDNGQVQSLYDQYKVITSLTVQEYTRTVDMLIMGGFIVEIGVSGGSALVLTKSGFLSFQALMYRYEI